MPRLPLIVSLVLIGLALAASAWLYPALPDRIPTHWNIRGEADGFGPKAIAAWILPVVALGLLAFLRAVPWLSPRDFRVEERRAGRGPHSAPQGGARSGAGERAGR